MRNGSMFLITSVILFILSINVNLHARFRTIDSETGLEWGEFEVSSGQDFTGAVIYALRIDPRFYEFALLSGSEYSEPAMTPGKWCERFGYEIAFNAGMYAADKSTTIGYCKNYDHVINPRLNRHRAVLAFNPKDTESPPVRIINRACEDFDSLKGHYNTFLQSIRMLGCDGGNVWNQSDDRHSILALAEDNSGRILVLFTQVPLSVHDFTELTLGLDLGLADMMYLEGSFQSSLFINTGSFYREISGVIRDLWPIKITANASLPLPNVIAVRKKTAPRD